MFGDQFHGPALRRPRDGAGRERRGQRVERMAVLAELALDRGHDVHHLREALDLHQLRRSDAARHAHATEIVPSEVDEHRVLRLLLGIGQQLVLEKAVADLGLPPRSGARDRASERTPSLDPNERFR